MKVLDGVLAGTITTVVLDQWALATYNIPLAAITAAGTGALVPLLLLDKEPFFRALRLWVGSVAFALLITGIIIAFITSWKPAAVPLAGVIAMFARDLFASIQGQVPPIVASLRERVSAILGSKEDK